MMFQLALKVQLRKEQSDCTEEFADLVLRHKQNSVLQAYKIDGTLSTAVLRILERREKVDTERSGRVVNRVEVFWLDIARNQSLRGGSYIPSPAALKDMHLLVVNVLSKDNRCLRLPLRAACSLPCRLPCRETNMGSHRGSSGLRRDRDTYTYLSA